MISDFVKGKKQFDFPTEIQAGIKLHRAIDAFTDAHKATKVIKEAFRPYYRLYAGAFADIVYDYFLANDINEFKADDELMDFTRQTFAKLSENEQWLYGRFGIMFPNMRAQNWLYNYQFDWGIQKSFEGLKRRSMYIEEVNTAFGIFLKEKNAFKDCYSEFFPGVKAMSLEFLSSV